MTMIILMFETTSNLNQIIYKHTHTHACVQTHKYIHMHACVLIDTRMHTLTKTEKKNVQCWTYFAPRIINFNYQSFFFYFEEK